MGEVVVKWTNGDERRYKNAGIIIEKRIIVVYFEDRTVIIPFENVKMMERMEGEDDEIPSESYH